MVKLYWWSCYGRFTPGEGIWPHMGEVLAEYRLRRGFRTQAELAIAAGILPRTISEWENKAMLRDLERRVFLAKLLKIPPALFGLDWRAVAYEDNSGQHTRFSTQTDEMWLEDSYYHYEDSLVMSWDLIYSGHFMQVADRFERRWQKLSHVVRNISGSEKEAWLGLLCQYCQLAMRIPQHQGSSEVHLWQGLQRGNSALQLAMEIEDHELLAATLFRLADTYRNYGQDELAREAALRAMAHVDQVPDAVKGNLYLLGSDTCVQYSGGDAGVLREIRDWQDKALNIVYKGKLESDRSFLRLNHAAVHHERAKLLLKISQLQSQARPLLDDAQNEMKLAWEALTPDLFEWRMYFFNTEARLYLASGDLEGSARLGLNALHTAQEAQSKKGEKQVHELYTALHQRDSRNPYICNLGVELGVF